MRSSAVVCDACGTSQISHREPIRTGLADGAAKPAGRGSDSAAQPAERGSDSAAQPAERGADSAAQPVELGSERVEVAYPALRMGRLRRTSQRHRRGRRGAPSSVGRGPAAKSPASESPATDGAPPAATPPREAPAPRLPADSPTRRLPEPPSGPEPELKEDMEPATIIARPDFDDIEERRPQQPSAGRRYVGEELEPAREPRGEPAREPRGERAPEPRGERAPEPPAPFEDRPLEPRPTRKLSEPRPLTTVYGALDPDRGAERRPVRLDQRQELAGKSAPRTDADWDQPAEPQALAQRRSALKERFAGPDLDIEDAAEEPVTGQRRVDHARLTGGHRSDIHTKRLASSPEDDLVLSEVAKQYSREYTGREGWSGGAIVDSVAYTFRVMGRTAGRTMAIRRLRKERERRERVRSDQLSELGEVALSLRDLDNALLDDYRSRLLELHHEQEMREDEVDSLNQQIESSRRNFAQAERHAQAEADELASQIKLSEEGLRPVEAGYRTALKAARSAEEDARALARQIDHARGELSRMSGAEASGDEAARLKARMERWSSERDGLLREVPRLEEKATALEPEIDRLRKEVERSKAAARDQRETTLAQEAEHKREVQRLEGEVERIRVAIENIAGQRRTLFGECGRQLDIDRPDHDHLEEIYGELDAVAAEIRRFDHEIEIAGAKPDPLDVSALTRAAVALCGVIIVVSLFIWAVS